MKGIYLQYTYLFNPFDYRTLITWIISPCIDLITGPANGFFTVQFQEFFIHKLDMKILIHYIQTVAHAFYNSLQFISIVNMPPSWPMTFTSAVGGFSPFNVLSKRSVKIFLSSSESIGENS